MGEWKNFRTFSEKHPIENRIRKILGGEFIYIKILLDITTNKMYELVKLITNETRYSIKNILD